MKGTTLKKIVSLLFAAALTCAVVAGCAGATSNSAASAAASSQASASASSSASAASASSAESASSEEAKTPITADMIAEGTYQIEVQSSSSMFRIVECELTVADGKMVANVTLSAHGYEKLYLGTGEEAANAPEDQYLMFSDEDNDGRYSYVVPVAALDADIQCAAFSINKQTWYDRTLVFESNNIPADKITR